ncbi:MAG TPA: GGDEF domain-containing protein [Dermatophilaceae bacterium]|nr:GGDEF domain-containing protein [Dermatophilaceae bacterium]
MTLSTDVRRPIGSYRSWLPRLSSAVMVDLRLWMLGFGLLIGLAFPFVVVLLGVPRDVALRPGFFAATLIAGLVVAEVNHLLARAVVGVRLRSLASGMQRVEGSLVAASESGDWVGCDPTACMVPVDSTDELGEVAASFNRLVAGLSNSHRVSDGIKSLSKALAAHLELGTLAEAMLSELSIRTGCDAAGLLVVSNGRVDVAGSHGIRDAERLASDQTVLAALRTAQPAVLRLPADVVVSGSLVDFIPQEVQVLPVLYGVVPVGVLVVAFAHPSSPEAGAVLNATLPGLAVALNNALNHEDLQRVAALDPLTGVYNRRFGLQRLTEECGRSIRSGDPLGALMFDLDHFKAVNDTYGHLVGDRVLQAVVRATRQVLRVGDVLLRYGGEEFLIVLPGAGRDDLVQMAERVRRAVAEAEIIEAGQRIPVTVSIGGSGLPDKNVANPQDLIALADAAMYTSKESGRDRYVIA